MRRSALIAAAFLFAVLAPVPGAAREVIDSAGRRVVLPERIERVFAAGPPAAVIVAADGHIAAEGRPAEVLTAERLSATYGVKVEVETTQSGARVARPVLDGKTRPNP